MQKHSIMGSSSFDASDVLAAALEQMDGIIASTKFEFNSSGHKDYLSWKPRHSVSSNRVKVMTLLNELKEEVESSSSQEDLLESIPGEVLTFLRVWVRPHTASIEVNGYLSESVEDKLNKLESDKQSLMLQVSVLTDQVEAQAEKISEMEYSLDDRREKLINTEDMLQTEVLTRTSLESHKLDLMAEISSLKVRLSAADTDRRDLDDKLRIAKRQIGDLQTRLTVKDAEISDLHNQMLRNGTGYSQEQGGNTSDCTLDRDRTLDKLKRKQTEVANLKRAVESLMVANEEKDRKLDDMKRLLKRYRRVEELLVQAQGRKAVDELLIIEDDTSSTSSSTTPSTGEVTSQTDKHRSPHYLSSPSATSTPVHASGDFKYEANHLGPAPAMTSSNRQVLGMTRSNSCENIGPPQQKTPSTSKKKTDTFEGGYGTLPKERYRDDERDGKRSRGFPALGKTLMRVRSGKRSCSAPNLAHTEVMTDDEDGLLHMGHQAGSGHEGKKKKGIKRFFGKLKRSSSQDFDGDRPEEFRRGGVRATATARLGWSRDVKASGDLDIPFARWDGDRVTAWMNAIGLNMYLVDCKRWVRNGEQLLRASPQDLEKELGMKNGLHRKKLQLALQVIGLETSDRFAELDHNWVTRWLDDIGLPQYKDAFYDARVDGRMLHFMTIEDLMSLRVTNELHHVSLKRGIQVLRVNGFNPQCLKRRPSPEEGHLHNIAGSVALWTNHRVMEWLRTIDLSEYAPNLRGSGVHGALMVLEPRFNAELFAQLLSIPPNKTLLRRHLSTHFVGLIGQDTQQRKREFEASPAFVALLPNSKIKKGKFGIFGHKRSKSETEADGFVCPLDNLSSTKECHVNGNGIASNGKHDPKRGQVGAKEIGAFSKEINSLTNMLAQERFLESCQTSNV